MSRILDEDNAPNSKPAPCHALEPLHIARSVGRIEPRFGVRHEGCAGCEPTGQVHRGSPRTLRTARTICESKVLGVAKAGGLDVDRLKMDMQAPEISARLGQNIALAQTLGINGTPGFAVGKKTGRRI